jgi:hypothetical protein
MHEGRSSGQTVARYRRRHGRPDTPDRGMALSPAGGEVCPPAPKDRRTDVHHTEKDPGPAGFVAGEGDAYDYIPDWMVIPGLYTTENQPDPLAVIELFTPDSSWTWFVLEYDPDERVAFGPVEGLETELGYISIEEMERATGPRGLRVERDEWFEPTPITELPEYRARWPNGGPYEGSPKDDTPAGDTPTPAAQEPEPAGDTPVGASPDGWTVEDVHFLLDRLEEGPILVADSSLGIPTIHDLEGARHCGCGLFELSTPD